MISYLVDIARVRQYFVQIIRAQDLVRATRSDVRFLDELRRGLLPLPTDRPTPVVDPFPPLRHRRLRRAEDRRVAVVATGGSGALASMVGVVRALEEAGVAPVAYAVCSGSALFGVPLAAGLPAADVSRWVQGLRPRDYLDPDWAGLAAAPLRLGRGWSGVLRGEAVESAYRRLLGDVTLAELPTPVWIPVFNIEDNRLEYLGPDTQPDLAAARAVRLAVGLPIAVMPGRLDGGWWLDGGIVDILPAEPFLGTDRCDLAVVVNGFYRKGFQPDQELGWRHRTFSVVHVSNQTRSMQHVRLAQQSYAALQASVPDVVELAPVDYARVQGAGLYGEFLDNRRWASYMTEGYHAAVEALSHEVGSRLPA